MFDVPLFSLWRPNAIKKKTTLLTKSTRGQFLSNFAQLSIGIFSLIEPRMSMQIGHLQMLNFKRKSSQNVGFRVKKLGKLSKK